MAGSDLGTDRPLQRGLAKAIARSWKDETYRALLLEDPRAALAELGVAVPEGTVIRVVPDDLVELTLPGPDCDFNDESVAAVVERLLNVKP